MKIYEIDTADLEKKIHKGQTVIKMITLEDYERVLRRDYENKGRNC